MTVHPRLRLTESASAMALASELQLVFPRATVEHHDQAEVEQLPEGPRSGGERPRIVWDADSGRVFVFLYDDQNSAATMSICLRPLQVPDVNDLQFANAYTRVFNDDVRSAPQTLRHDELWNVLSLSRISRSIARLSAFGTAPFLRWLNIVESAAHLRYEGDRFRASVFMTKQKKWITEVAGDGFLPFQQHVRFRDALLEDK